MLFFRQNIIASVWLVFILIGCGNDPVITGLEGKKIPSVKLLMPDSVSIFNTNKFLKGHPVVYFYFLPDCPFCREEMKYIVNNMSSLKEIQLCVLTSHDFVNMKQFYSYFGLDKFRNVVMGYDDQYIFQNYFNASVVPITAICNKEGKLVRVYLGKVTVAEILKASVQ
jgi:peroxiredoxin